MFCPNCGTMSSGGKFCAECGTELPVLDGNTVNKPSVQAGTSANGKKTKVIVGSVIGGVVVLILLIVLITMPHSVDKRCDWCGRKPSYEYTNSKGEKTYVCDDCRSQCAVCGKPSQTHYENMLGMMVFVCNDCYDRVWRESRSGR